MKNQEWITLLQQIPAEFYNQVVLLIDGISEVAVETVFRIESTFVAVRGRRGGTTESGLLFMVPYSRLSALLIAREITEDEVQRLWPTSSNGIGAMPGLENPNQGPLPGLSEPEPTQPAQPQPVAAPPATRGPNDSKTAITARNNLLEKLRAARGLAPPASK